eukprot:9312833-Alexandrium_andersonii.AAC.1
MVGAPLLQVETIVALSNPCLESGRADARALPEAGESRSHGPAHGVPRFARHCLDSALKSLGLQ